MNRQNLIKDLKASGNLRTFLKILEHDEKEVTKFLKGAGLDTFQRVQGRLNTIEEYKNLITNAFR
jgi:cupin superfamily acireductone dioxygenase involved in methionine salvage